MGGFDYDDRSPNWYCKKCKIKSNIFVLACGAIENARILLNNIKHNKILQNNNIGKYFMEHPRTNLGTVKSNKKLSLSTLFGIKKMHYDFRQVVRLSEKTQQDKKILNAHMYLNPKFQNKTWWGSQIYKGYN